MDLREKIKEANQDDITDAYCGNPTGTLNKLMETVRCDKCINSEVHYSLPCILLNCSCHESGVGFDSFCDEFKSKVK